MTDLLARIRAALGVSGEEPDRRARVAARLAAPSIGPAPARARGARAELMEAFRSRLQSHHGTAETIAELSNAPSAIAAWLAERALPERAVIAPALAHLDWSALAVEVRAPRSDDRIGISPAALGVAETGSLLLYAGANEPLTLAFVPETHIVLLAAADIVGSLEEVWAEQRRRFPERPPQALTLVSGPSRTADIEQTMYLGAHGPKCLHVLIAETREAETPE